VLSGETGKLEPLALLPIATPSVGDVYQSIVLLPEVALRFEVCPKQMDDGVAVTGFGKAGGVNTETNAETEHVQPFEFT
jgi:hypothetical protein